MNDKRINFLSTALKGNFSIDSEDRLTQVFSACFNCSPTIKRVTLKYLLGTSFQDVSKFEIRTQIQMSDNGERTNSRPDMIIYRNDNCVAIIESKVDAPLESNQLKRHFQNFKGFQSVNFITLTQQIQKKEERPWIQKYWFELAKRIEYAKSEDEVDAFILIQMIIFFKEHIAMRVQTITFDDLKNASDCIGAIQNFKGGLVDIEALYKMNEFIKVVVEKISANKWFYERLNRNPTKKLTLYDWYYENKDEGKGVNIGKNLYLKIRSKTRRVSINFLQKIESNVKAFPSRLSIAVWDSSSFDEVAVWAIKDKSIYFKKLNSNMRQMQEITADDVCTVAEETLRYYFSQKDAKEIDIRKI